MDAFISACSNWKLLHNLFVFSSLYITLALPPNPSQYVVGWAFLLSSILLSTVVPVSPLQHVQQSLLAPHVITDAELLTAAVIVVCSDWSVLFWHGEQL